MSDISSDEPDRSEEHSPPFTTTVVYLLSGLTAYVGVFALLFLDSIVWRTHYADRWIPTACHTPMRIFFYPLLWACHRLGWLPGDLPPIR